MSSLLEKECNFSSYVPGAQAVKVDGKLRGSGLEFWKHTEYPMRDYLMRRLLCDRRSFSIVASPTEADICFPDCSVSRGGTGRRLMQAFAVHLSAHTANASGGCSSLTFSPEARGKCKVNTPYLHGVVIPDASMSTYDLHPMNSRRATLLVYIGGVWRGKRRKQVVDQMHAEARQVQPGDPTSVFDAPFVFKNHGDEKGKWGTADFFVQVWRLYAKGHFSWQPVGDTPTRRGFYDSWLLGCIPVIGQGQAHHYASLFNGQLFKDVPLEKVVVVLPESTMEDGKKILRYLQRISTAEIERRRALMKRMAPALQWGWNASSDALRVGLSSVL
eukprot:TRINITY_DN8504_c0_g1_i11.p1 TRINITY_DN8504_c0_g1~~TRINITY_DN8504_c0_g1_i11.p1  ORF type:complete len:330 (+),score=12.00 TRINITY_DN8504_c0_g1_i11:443-1432(+)